MNCSFRTMLAVVAAMVCGLAAPAAADGPTPTNRELATKMSREIAQEFIDGVRTRLSGESVEVKPYAVDEVNNFINSILVSVLTENGVETRRTSAIPAGVQRPRYILEHQLLNFVLAYPDVYRSWLIGGKKVKRWMNVSVRATLIDSSDGSVVWSAEASRDYKDVFPSSERARVEASSFAFTRADTPPSSWGRYMEPVLVSGIVVGLVYLFFSNQNNEN